MKLKKYAKYQLINIIKMCHQDFKTNTFTPQLPQSLNNALFKKHVLKII